MQRSRCRSPRASPRSPPSCSGRGSSRADGCWPTSEHAATVVRLATMAWSPPPARSGHPYYMHDAIYAQPGALRLVERGNGDALAQAASRIAALDRVVLAGIGTSWHAALVGELLLARVARLGERARAFHSFELARYWPSPDERTVVVLVTHRGSKRYSREVLGPATDKRGVSVLLTGKGSEPLAADITLRTV